MLYINPYGISFASNCIIVIRITIKDICCSNIYPYSVVVSIRNMLNVCLFIFSIIKQMYDMNVYVNYLMQTI